jgi:hypothetical protein
MVRRIKVRILCYIFLFLVVSSTAEAVTTISSNTIFPYNATTSGETYRLSEDISCETTCIVLSGAADNAIIDLNGHTMTFGTANAVTVLNSDFEAWTGPVPDDWTVESGDVSSTAAIDWGSFDLSASNAFRIRSAAFNLNANQTYQAWAFVKASSSASGTLRILSASDNSTIASLSMPGDEYFNRGFAVRGTPLTYKPTENVSVKLELETVGAYSYRVAEINMAPYSHFGIVNYSYRNTSLFPDLGGVTSWGLADNVTIQNGTITQGNGHASYSSSTIFETTPIIAGVVINVSGPNSAGIRNFGAITDSTINFTSTTNRVFNRMYGANASGATKSKGYDTPITIDNLTINGFPQYGITVYNCPTAYDNGGSIEIKNSKFYGAGVVTEPYAMAFSGAKNLNIHDNTIDPGGKVGRGILVDAVGCVDPQIEGATGSIYNNRFLNIWEDENFEYDATGLESVGIRIRNWGGDYEGHKLDIYGNTFTYTNTSSGSHATYGININASSPYDELKIYNNTFSVNAHATAGTWAAAIALQGFGDIATTRHIIRNNVISSNSYGIGFDGNDGANSTNISIYSNQISAGVSPIRFGMSAYTGVDSDIDIHCNQITNTGLSGYPIYLNGTLTDILIDYNQITNSNSDGFETWADSDESSDVLFFGNGTIDVTGGGSIGTALSATNGSDGCWSTAGIVGRKYRFLTAGD